MKISIKYIRLILSLILLIAFLPKFSNAQVVYKGINSATAKGTALGQEVNDNSNSGTTVNKTDDTPTPITFPMIGLAKTVGTLSLQTDGTYNVTYTLRIQNYSTIVLNNIQITDDLSAVFPGGLTNATFTITTPNAVSKLGTPVSNGSGAITVNSAFNGSTDKNLLVAASSSLTSNASGDGYFATIRFTINVDPQSISAAYKTYNNTATVTAKTPITVEDPAGITVTDVSHNNTSPNQSSTSKTPLFYNTPTPITLGVSDIEVKKTVDNATPFEGTNVIFSIKVKNKGTATAAPVVVNDLLPAGYQFVSYTAEQGTYIDGTGVWSVGTLANGVEKELKITAKVLTGKSPATVYNNIASSDHPGDPIPTNNNSTVDVTPKKTVDLKITNSDGKTDYIPGKSNTYIIVVTNDGPRDVRGATVKNTLPPSIGFTGNWTAVYTDGGNGLPKGALSGTGNINELVDIPSGSYITYTYVVDVPSNYTGEVSAGNPYKNTATVALPILGGLEDPTPLNNTATDSDNREIEVKLKITKTTDPVATNYTPGRSIIYTVTVTNAGPSDAIGANIVDNLPTGTTTATWSAVYSSGSSGVVANGTTINVGSIDQAVTIPNGGTITYTVTLTVPPGRTGNLVNTATITKPSGTRETLITDNTETVTLTQESKADLQITKTDSQTTFIPGKDRTYTIVVTNAGPSNVVAATVTDALLAGFTGELSAVYSTNTNGTATGSSATGVPAASTGINETVSMPSGTTITYTFKVTMPSNYTGATLLGTFLPTPPSYTATTKYFVNEATVTAPVGVTDGDLTNNNAKDPDIVDLQADLKITNTDGKLVYVPGTNNVYTITVENDGPSDVIGATIANSLPAGVTVSSWTAVSNLGLALTTAAGTGDISVVEDMPKGRKITYTVTMAIPPGRTVDVVSVATVTAPAGVTEINLLNNSATDTDEVEKKADLQITKTDSQTTFVPGQSRTYTIVVTNAGPSNVVGATVTDALLAGFTGELSAVYSTNANGTATGSSATVVPAASTGINETVSMPSGTTITYTFKVNMPSSYLGTTLPLAFLPTPPSYTPTTKYFVNEATVTVPATVTDTDLTNNTAKDPDIIDPKADMKVVKVADNMSPVVDSQVKFTMSVTNLGPSDATGVVMTDIIKSGYTYISAVPSVGTYNPVTGIWTIGNVVYNQSVNLVVTALVLPEATPANYANTASVTANETDPVLTNNNITINPTPLQLVDLVMGKSVSNPKPEVDSEITFTLTVRNDGPSNATNVIVEDLLQAGYKYLSSTPSVGSYDPTTGLWSVGNLANGAQVQLLVRVKVNANFSSADYVNTSVVKSSQVEKDNSNNTATVITIIPGPIADLEILKSVSTLNPSFNTNVIFTLNATNKGPSDATNVIVTDLLKAGFKFISAIPSVGTYNQTTGIWSVGMLAFKGTATLKITALVNAIGPHDNTAVIKATENDPILTNNTSTVVLNTQAKPITVNDEAKICVGSPVVIDILANDLKSVTNIIPSTVVVIKQPTNGTVSIDPITGKATYTPNIGATGNDEFSYTVKDANGGTSNEAVVRININQPIFAVNDNITTDPNVSVVINLLLNDIAGSAAIIPSSLVITQQPTNGSITIDAAGKATYTPNNNFVGTDSFKYTLKDANGCISNVATVDIKVNDLPKIGLAKSAMAITKQQNGSYNITYHFVVGNYGTTKLNNISIKDDLKITFKGDKFSVKSITTLGTLKINNQYNGNSDIELLASGNTLIVGDLQQLEMVVNVIVGADRTTYLNSAIAEGTSLTGIKTTDISTDGLSPDINGDVSPAVPTPVDLKRPKEFIPEGFSPNRDGMNDTFVISNMGNKRVSLEIYNRWGNIVYKKADYKNDWSGESNQGIRVGSELPEGTYFYIIILDGKDKYVGSITLKR